MSQKVEVEDQLPAVGLPAGAVSPDQVIVQMDGFLSFELAALDVMILVCGALVVRPSRGKLDAVIVLVVVVVVVG